MATAGIFQGIADYTEGKKKEKREDEVSRRDKMADLLQESMKGMAGNAQQVKSRLSTLQQGTPEWETTNKQLQDLTGQLTKTIGQYRGLYQPHEYPQLIQRLQGWLGKKPQEQPQGPSAEQMISGASTPEQPINPYIQKRDWAKEAGATPQRAEEIAGLAQPPDKLVKSENRLGDDGKLHTYHTYSPVSGPTYEKDVGLAAPKTSGAGKTIWVQAPGEDEPRQAMGTAGNFVDAITGEALPPGAKTVASPVQQRMYGIVQAFYWQARSRGMNDLQAKEEAGRMATQYYGTQLGRTIQQGEIDQALSDIPLRPAFGSEQKAAPAAQQAPSIPKTPGEARERLKAVAPKEPAKTTGKETGITDKERDDINIYLGSLFGTIKAGAKSSQVKVQAGQRALSKLTGVDPMTLNASLAEDKATAKQLAETVQRAGAIQRLNETLELHGKVLTDKAKAIIQTGSPLLNRPFRELERIAAGSPELGRFKIAINAVQREYAYLTAGGAQSRAMLPVTVSQTMESLFRPDATLAEIVAGVDQVRIEAAKEEEALKNTQKDLIGNLQTGLSGRAVGAPSGTGKEYKMKATGPQGHKIGSNDGINWFDLQTGQAIK